MDSSTANTSASPVSGDAQDGAAPLAPTASLSVATLSAVVSVIAGEPLSLNTAVPGNTPRCQGGHLRVAHYRVCCRDKLTGESPSKRWPSRVPPTDLERAVRVLPLAYMCCSTVRQYTCTYVHMYCTTCSKGVTPAVVMDDLGREPRMRSSSDRDRSNERARDRREDANDRHRSSDRVRSRRGRSSDRDSLRRREDGRRHDRRRSGSRERSRESRRYDRARARSRDYDHRGSGRRGRSRSRSRERRERASRGFDGGDRSRSPPSRGDRGRDRPAAARGAAPPKRIRPNCKQFGGLLAQVVTSRKREDDELRLAADARLAELEFGDRNFHKTN